VAREDTDVKAATRSFLALGINGDYKRGLSDGHISSSVQTDQVSLTSEKNIEREREKITREKRRDTLSLWFINKILSTSVFSMRPKKEAVCIIDTIFIVPPSDF
jgi:hypothetical protein